MLRIEMMQVHISSFKSMRKCVQTFDGYYSQKDQCNFAFFEQSEIALLHVVMMKSSRQLKPKGNKTCAQLGHFSDTKWENVGKSIILYCLSFGKIMSNSLQELVIAAETTNTCNELSIVLKVQVFLKLSKKETFSAVILKGGSYVSLLFVETQLRLLFYRFNFSFVYNFYLCVPGVMRSQH